MKLRITAKVLGILLMIFSISMLTPVPVSLHFHNHDVMPFVDAFSITWLTGFVLWLIGHRSKQELRTRDGFLIVFLMWFVLGAFGALPFMLSYSPSIPWSDALFESVSGLTTTGATTLQHIDQIPQAVLYYRQQLQFLGGMGIIVLAVAIMPMIGVGGMQLYKAETTGPMKENKLTPRITETAKALWLIYVILNLACIIGYWLCGMSIFDAVNFAFATVSTGGYAPHNSSIAYYHTNATYIVSIIFMLLGAANFSLHYLAFWKMRFKVYWENYEFRAYVMLYAVASLVVMVVLIVTGVYHHFGQALLNSVYQVVSFATTTGFVTNAGFTTWPLFVPILLLLMGMIGGCAGSTTGGIKLIRVILYQRQISREIKHLIHPHGTFPLKLGKQLVPERVMSSAWAFLAAYIVIFVMIWLALMATGMDITTSFSAVATCISNTGPGLGEVSNNFAGIGATARWILTLAMLIGRLEVFTVLVLFSPAFWRH